MKLTKLNDFVFLFKEKLMLSLWVAIILNKNDVYLISEFRFIEIFPPYWYFICKNTVSKLLVDSINLDYIFLSESIHFTSHFNSLKRCSFTSQMF